MIETAAREQRSAEPVVRPVRPRKLVKVPFVELADGRLQGVVSSGSDLARVYVSSISAATHGFSCSTNNNRPCGGLSGGSPCKHLRALADEAVLQYGLDRVARYLRAEAGDDDDLMSRLDGTREAAPAAGVFSRFLRHLAYLELPGSTAPIAEMHWFPAVSAEVR
ncbi:hypothetical protein [Actinoallomurus iriomotensis]|uniref:SWIM-type domain-containing protein n=1 Tax=Actinoallomurus iriomotensis TaxID=478107 RepID=A0A9W6RZN4_9ACTN|nr:hypothetical protein [Actinoallomurus iriomotensis]GLY82780.1 hypothetical protein Airi02_007110 [Actinoallomurus iriomotensis]